jgi:hypothetical protein
MRVGSQETIAKHAACTKYRNQIIVPEKTTQRLIDSRRRSSKQLISFVGGIMCKNVIFGTI